MATPVESSLLLGEVILGSTTTEDEVVGVDVETSPVAGVADPGVDDTADVVAALAISGAIGGLVMLALVLVGGIGRGLGILVSYKGFRTPPTKVRVF